MYDPISIAAIAATILIGLSITAYAGLTCWRGWLEFKQLELRHVHVDVGDVTPSTGSRIEVADLKERVRKLEAIAAGIEL